MKLDIIGSVASGKTTLARKLSTQYQIPFYEKDNIVWERTPDGDKRRNPEDRDQMFRQILAQEHWIVEGSPRDILQESFACCDYIILLDINTFTRLFRVFRRWLRQRTGRESYNSRPTLRFLYANLLWVAEFNQKRTQIISSLSAYGEKLKRFNDEKDVLNFVAEKYEKSEK